MMTFYSSRPCFNRILSRSLTVAALAAVSLLAGLTPELSKDTHTLVFSSSASAQNDGQVRNYAMASVEIERLRQKTYEEIKRINGGAVPNIPSCSGQGLPANIRQIWVNFCAQSEDIIQKYGFSNQSYNAITKKRQSDSSLNARVQAAVNELIRQGF